MSTNYPSDLPYIFTYDYLSNKISFGNEKKQYILSLYRALQFKEINIVLK